jgi:hypothetical protein
MKIGAPAAFGVGAEGIAEPSFGVISRIFRPSATTVAVDILKLGQYVGATVTGKDAAALKQTGGATANLLAAITVSDNTGDPKLMLPPRIQLRENDPLFIAQSEGVQGITLGKLQSVTRGFYLFRFKPSAE